MTTYTCPIHNIEYGEVDPMFEAIFARIGHTCPECYSDQRAKLGPLEQAYDRAWRRWDSWNRSSDVPRIGRNRTLANHRAENKAQQAAHRVIKAYACSLRNHLQSGKGLTLLGPPGVGKSHLCYGLIAAAYEADIHARYIVWGDVVDRVKAAFGQRDSEDARLVERLKELDLLVLDEIGVRSGSEWDQNQLFGLIDHRYRHQRPTVVASNLTAETLNNIGERAADRLREANVTVSIPGESRRAAAGVDRDLIDAPPALMEPEPPVITFPVCVNGEVVEREARVPRREPRAARRAL
jgi:DNA replication protein DnaC